MSNRNPLGCNYQAGGLVLGAEADFNGSSIGERINSSYGPAGPFVGSAFLASSHTETITKDLDWFSTFRGRIGFTRFMTRCCEKGTLPIEQP